MRNSIIRAYALGIITGGFLAAGVLYAAAPAKADGQLNSSEADYVLRYEYEICAAIDANHSTAQVLRIADVVRSDGFAPDEAVDIINASVQEACPRNWPLLVAIGRAARAQNGSTA